ncbi:uncharacterized protein ARMOST_16803 [Armillaria ostoyae]|uniref:Uncharacterized protein n=1 Tax=Armillaria ostoyae TaxID=47428 RepID=A0A284RX69_ARMOS|nr:uncharacterized protein ARMOST_16803 [Armillaria ostoyae]
MVSYARTIYSHSQVQLSTAVKRDPVADPNALNPTLVAHINKRALNLMDSPYMTMSNVQVILISFIITQFATIDATMSFTRS